jgi:hypothetical protein
MRCGFTPIFYLKIASKMIVIPMLGRSSRFLDAGYSVPKYQLPLAGETVFSQSVRSFERQFQEQHFLFLVRNDHSAKEFVSKELAKLGLRDYQIIEFSHETRGQAESVMLGHDFTWPAAAEFGDGFLEVFRGSGSAWSFVEPGTDHAVIRTAEKQRISDLCSNGLYGFAKLEDFRNAYINYDESGCNVNGEQYIAPLYNHLIERGLKIKYRLVGSDMIDHCGVPADYEQLKRTLGA